MDGLFVFDGHTVSSNCDHDFCKCPGSETGTRPLANTVGRWVYDNHSALTAVKQTILKESTICCFLRNWLVRFHRTIAIYDIIRLLTDPQIANTIKTKSVKTSIRQFRARSMANRYDLCYLSLITLKMHISSSTIGHLEAIKIPPGCGFTVESNWSV